MDNIILAIETSIKAGSLALMQGTRTIANWSGNGNSSRSEDLLPQISRLLAENRLDRRQLQKIAVSVGPGSFTGIRIGIATAKALALALGCRLIGVSLLESIAAAYESSAPEKITVVVSAGRDFYFWQKFDGIFSLSEPTTGTEALLEQQSEPDEVILAEQNAYDNLREDSREHEPIHKILPVTGNYAELIGRCALEKSGIPSDDVLPLYIRPAVMLKKQS